MSDPITNCRGEGTVCPTCGCLPCIARLMPKPAPVLSPSCQAWNDAQEARKRGDVAEYERLAALHVELDRKEGKP